MINKFFGVSISVIISAFLAPFLLVSADEVSEPEQQEPEQIIESEQPEQVQEPEQLQELPVIENSETTITTLITTDDKICLAAIEDIVSVLDEQAIVYDDTLSDDLYDHLSPYLYDDYSEYIIDFVRADMHEIILAHIDPESEALYSEKKVDKYIDKVFDDIFVVSEDNQDSVFLDLVSISLLSSILVCLIFVYFVQ